MPLPSSGSYEELDYTAQPEESATPLSTGLPARWWPCISGLVSLGFSVVWMMESWRTAKPLLGFTKVNHLTQDLWGLLLTLGTCYVLYWLFKSHSKTLGFMLCLVVATLAMAWHRL